MVDEPVVGIWEKSEVFGEPVSLRLISNPEHFPKLPALAERLGVSPGDHGGKFFLIMNDGRKYDVFALVTALLDRLDGVSELAREK